MDFFAQYGLILAYILLAMATIGALYVAVMDVLRNPKSGKSSLIGILAFIIILGISFIFSSSQTLPGLVDDEVSKAYYHITGTGLIALYIVGGLAVIGLLVSEIISFIKNV